jgi:hypothetical protein
MEPELNVIEFGDARASWHSDPDPRRAAFGYRQVRTPEFV